MIHILQFNTEFSIDHRGQVFSLRQKRYLAPYKLESGIWTVKIPDPNTGVRKRFQVHRLVAENFLANPNGFNYVTFKNEDKNDYQINNLKWIRNSKFTGRFGDING